MESKPRSSKMTTGSSCFSRFSRLWRDSIYVILLLSCLVLFESAYIYSKGSRWMTPWLTFERKMPAVTDVFITKSDSARQQPTIPTGATPRRNHNISTSQNYIVKELGYDTCRFSSIFDESKLRYPLSDKYRGASYVYPGTSRKDLKNLMGWNEAGRVLDEIRHKEKQLIKSYDDGNSTEKRVNQTLTFVHIGKAGGSTVNCHLRRPSHKYTHCDNDVEAVPETAISRHVNCYTHGHTNLLCYYLRQGAYSKEDWNGTKPKQKRSLERLDQYKHHHGNDYLVNVRSPLDRIASWFLYEHVENHNIVREIRQRYCGQLVLNSCYRSFQDLTVVGLSGPKPPSDQPLRVGLNLTEEECSHWAWATVQGNIPAENHNFYNYDFHAHRMLYDSRSNKSSIYLLRVEHLEQDWSTVDIMLGGDGVVPPTLTAARQNSAEVQPLLVADHDTTPKGIQNLCQALCEEIQVYKQLLLHAVNLEAIDLDESMEELRSKCPKEVDLGPRDCS